MSAVLTPSACASLLCESYVLFVECVVRGRQLEQLCVVIDICFCDVV
jgi:hypothetical protein